MRSPLRPSAERWDTSPAGGGKCTGVNRGKVCGKANTQKRLSYHKVSLYLRACTWLPLWGSWREAPERATKKRPFPDALHVCIIYVKKNILGCLRGGGRRKKRTAPIAGKQRGRLYCFGWGWRMDTPQPCGSAWPAAGPALSGAALRGGSCSSGINSLLMTVSISSSLFTSSGEKRSRTRSMTVCR